MAFFAGEMGTMTREYRVSAYFDAGLRVRIVTDASPWGVGGFVALGNTIISYFAEGLDQQDADLANAELGSPDGQQVWEALALLIALRLWQRYWMRTGVELRVKSDSVSALTLLIKLRAKPRATGLASIARELALEFSRCSYRPRWHEHVPGVANVDDSSLARRTSLRRSCGMQRR